MFVHQVCVKFIDKSCWISSFNALINCATGRQTPGWITWRIRRLRQRAALSRTSGSLEHGANENENDETWRALMQSSPCPPVRGHDEPPAVAGRKEGQRSGACSHSAPIDTAIALHTQQAIDGMAAGTWSRSPHFGAYWHNRVGDYWIL